jgi:hypothetical protein
MKHYRPFTPETISLGERVIREVRDWGVIGKSALGKLCGRTSGALENVLIYVTEAEPRIAETDDGKLIWAGEDAGKPPAYAGHKYTGEQLNEKN